MTSIVLGGVGTAIGGAVGGPMGASIGGYIGTMAGGIIDSHIIGSDTQLKARMGSRLSDLAVQSSAYGQNIPVIYGSARLAGNVIWSLPIKEVATTTRNTAGGGKGGGAGKVSQDSTVFTYSVTLAIAICEGGIDDIVRVWADAKVLNPEEGAFRLYKGTEEQMPDSLIESIEGIGKTPAYRGIAYVVIEDFPLADYGNRIPNFTFEVIKSAKSVDDLEVSVEEMVTSMVMIPGAGEFVYDDIVQSKTNGIQIGDVWAGQGSSMRINQNNRSGISDAIVALNQMEATCPNVEWVAVVATWFANSLDAGDCEIMPGVEFSSGAITEPDLWQVAGFNRLTARQITLVGDKPRYGGTPSDASLLRYIKKLKERGYKVMFYPMFFMDMENKPWRGRVSGSVSDVADFFTKTNGYNAFINHYANLVKNDVDAFVIGSELIGLTSVKHVDNSFPAVNALVGLAGSVKAIVGADVKVTYAADWSEYHHTNGGWYNLDPLWASPDIDMIGIDAYFPLTDRQEPLTGFTQEELMAGWESGEGYDWYYSDLERTIQVPLAPEYAWKNIAHWWQNEHVNPDSSITTWVPESKKIWFTEFGFPSVDGASNQPNVFIDPESSESHYPYQSRGRVDFIAQRNAIKASIAKWQGSNMVERMFLWTWDARPFPFWPDLKNIWADGELWKTGHWVQGKFGSSSLDAIVKDLSLRAGLAEEQIDVSRLRAMVDGYVINSQTTSRAAIDLLREAYFFDAIESNGIIKYIPRGGQTVAEFPEDELIPHKKGGESFNITRAQELELPQSVNVVYLNKGADYQSGNQSSQRMAVNSSGVEKITLPLVMSGQQAKIIADINLYNKWLGRSTYNFSLKMAYACLEPADIIEVSFGGFTYKMRIVRTDFGTPGIIKISAIAEDSAIYDFYNEPGYISPQTAIVADVGETILKILDLPPLPSDNEGQGSVRYAACGREAAWNGAVIFRSDDNGANYTQVSSVTSAAIMGVAIDVLPDASCDIFDEISEVTVNISSNGQLESLSEIAVLNGANLAKVGDEIIQFKNAQLLGQGQYRLSGLLRGRLGTEHATPWHVAGEEFILLDGNIIKEPMPNSLIGLGRLYKGVSAGKTLNDINAVHWTYFANSLKPFSPVHINCIRDIEGNITITWIRRTRLNGQWQDNVDAPLSEESEKYEIDILDGGNVVRTIAATLPLAVYSALEQEEDLGSSISEVHIIVYQISAIAGRGWGGRVFFSG